MNTNDGGNLPGDGRSTQPPWIYTMALRFFAKILFGSLISGNEWDIDL
jgi:hypothetical protein